MVTAHWLGNLAAWGAQSALLIAAGSASAWIFRLRMPRVRLACAQALLALCLLLPAIEPWQTVNGGRVDVATSASHAVTSAKTSASLPWRQALCMALACGCVVRTLWLAAGFGRLRRWRRTSRNYAPLPAHLEQLRAALAPRAGFRLSSSVSGPVTFGFRRPLIVLPESFAGLPAGAQEAVACHELLHVRRQDWIVTIIEEFLRAALWFHPAVWWLIGQIQLSREQTVDAAVVRWTRDRRQYLDALLAIAGNRPPLDLAPATLFLRKRHLKKRVALLLEEITMSKRTLISFCAASCGLLITAGWLALHTFPLQAAPVPQDQAASKLLHSVPPRYPQAAVEKHIEGSVVLEVHIDAAGHVSDAHVISGPEELRSAALEAILQWHYSPQAMTLPTTTQVTMDFKLPRNGAPATATRLSLPQISPFTLKDIQIDGMSSSASEELKSRLNVHVGDTVDTEVMHSIAEAVRKFDDHLSVAAKASEGTLQIFIPPAAAPAGPQGLGAARIRIGGNVQQAKLLAKASPVYPPEAKAQRIQGLVRLEAIVAKDGTIANLKVLSGDDLLAAAALEAVRQWQYQTTLLNGEPVEVVTTIDVNFTLEN